MKKNVIVISFCLLLLTYTMIASSANEPTAGNTTYTATDIDALFAGRKSTNSYIEFVVSSPEHLNINPILTEEYIDIYQWNTNLIKSDFSKFANDIASRLAEEVSDGNVENIFYDSYETVSVGQQIGFSYINSFQNGFCNMITIDSYFSSEPEEEMLSLDGIPVMIDPAQTDSDIIASLKVAKEKLFSIFDREFADCKIIRHSQMNITVYFYNENDHFLNTMRQVPVSDHICISFQENSIKNTGLHPKSIVYYQNRTNVKETYVVSQKMKMISLKEAEELLYKGYLFGNHCCPKCLSKNNKLNYLEGYDFVGMTYLFPTDDILEKYDVSSIKTEYVAEGIPFYVFYTKMDTLENGDDIYTKSYVPAIEVTGFEEYLESQKENHKHSYHN